MSRDALQARIDFLMETDRLKTVLRQTVLTDRSRNENSAEHSWSLALFALVLAPYAGPEVDIVRVIKMALLHDLVEIDCGDTFCYDEAAMEGKVAREQAAANRIFGMLPNGTGDEFRALWEEFEARETPDARFAAALDRLQPVLHNCYTNGAAWQKHGVTADKVIDRNRHIADGSEELWQFARGLIDQAVAKGHLETPAGKGPPTG